MLVEWDWDIQEYHKCLQELLESPENTGVQVVTLTDGTVKVQEEIPMDLTTTDIMVVIMILDQKHHNLCNQYQLTVKKTVRDYSCLLYTSPSPRDS